jgi:1,4-alpha-glucan branching enzyme
MKTPGIVVMDPWLKPYEKVIQKRIRKGQLKENELRGEHGLLKDFATGHLYFGLHKEQDSWVFREWAPNATTIYLVNDATRWQPRDDYRLNPTGHGNWEIKLPHEKLRHGDLFRLCMQWEGGMGDRIPSYAWRVVQDPDTKIFNAQVWDPPEPYHWKHSSPVINECVPFIYEAHVGMATERQQVSSFRDFTSEVLPRIHRAGYNVIQLMAIQEHPYYGSFGYHVSNFFAASSRFGPPEDLKQLIDEAHGMGIAVIMDLVHSHSVKNEVEGLGRFDGTGYQYFHDGYRREHIAWDSLCFNYGKNEVLHFLLSNCQYWLDEYRFDGFRFDGVTSMIYLDHGLSRNYASYDMYYDGMQDEDAIAYLTLANQMIHEAHPYAITVAEEMSGMPGTASPVLSGGMGFDYRLSMGTPDLWIKIIKELPDEKWNVNHIFSEISQHRVDEKTIGYCESHDQALVGDKTIIFRLIDKEMYYHMNKGSQNLLVDRGIALHKMIRLVTIATAGGGYLNFMGNEFGHPEWIDFPRQGNQWSYFYARRQWSLVDNHLLRYHYLADFDRVMIELIKSEEILKENYPFAYHKHVEDQVVAFARKDLYFIFNFNPTRSFVDYGCLAPAGKYIIALNTDDAKFGGQNLVDSKLTYFTQPEAPLSNKHYLKCYLPSRTALVFKRQETRKVL